MSSAQDAEDEILSLFKSVWDSTGITVFYDNITEQQSAEQNEYVLPTVQNGSGSIAALGTTQTRNNGFAIFAIFTRTGRGTARVKELAQIIADAFVTAPPGLVTYRNPSILYVGRDGKFLQTNVSIGFHYDRLTPSTA